MHFKLLVLIFCLGLTVARPNQSSNSSNLSREKRAPWWSWIEKTANKVAETAKKAVNKVVGTTKKAEEKVPEVIKNTVDKVCKGVDATGHEYENDDVEINVGQGKLRGCIEADSDGLKIMAEAGVDAANGNVDLGKDVNVGASIGLSVDTGIDVGGDGVEIKLGGVGGSVGCKNEVCLWFGCVTLTVC